MNVLNELDSGAINLALTRLINGGDRFKCLTVLTDHFVCVLCEDHPLALRGSLSIEDLADAAHLKITSDGDYTSFVDELLERQGLSRRVALGTPFLAATPLLASGELVAVVPARTAQRMCEMAPLATLPLPFEIAPARNGDDLA